MSDKMFFVAEMPQTGGVPSEFQVFPAGPVEIKGAGIFAVDGPSMDQVIANFRSRGLDMVIDYEHQTLGKTENADFSSPDGKAPAAGWIKDLVNRGSDGLWATVEWTAKARELLANREYRYFSPVFYVSKATGKLTELLTVALTNTPRLNRIRPIVAKDATKGNQMEGTMKKMAVLLGLPDTASQEDIMSAIEKAMGGQKTQMTAAKELGLPETATEEQVIAAINNYQTDSQNLGTLSTGVKDALGLSSTASISEIVASIHALKQRPDATVIQEIASLKARLAERDRDELVAAAIKVGKITPAQREWAEKYALTDAEGFRLFVAKAPVVVPVDKARIVPDDKTATDDTQLEINKLMGISEETYKKYHPAA